MNWWTLILVYLGGGAIGMAGYMIGARFGYERGFLEGVRYGRETAMRPLPPKDRK